MATPIINTGYGLSQPINNIPPMPVLAKRVPSTTDKNYELGTIWVYTTGSAAYILVSVAANSATWQLIEVSGGAGVFSTLTSTGAFTLDTTTAAVNTLGNTTGATSLSLMVGTGGFSLDGVAGSVYAVGASTTTGSITIGGSAQAGTITLGSSSASNTLVIAGGAGATTLQLANAQVAGSVSIGAAMTSGTITVGGTGLQVGTISIAPGTGAQSLLLGTGGTGVKTITVGGTAANVITIGNVQTAGSIAMGDAMTSGTIQIGGSGAQVGTISIAPGTSSQAVRVMINGTGLLTLGSTTGAAGTTIQGGTGGILISPTTGAIKMTPATVSAAAYAATLSSQLGQVTLTGQVLASAATQVLTITNTLCTTTTPIHVTVDNLGTNDAQLTITRVQLKAGSFEVTVKNNGAAALNGDIHVNFWLLS